jgi:periplasmic protein TonB
MKTKENIENDLDEVIFEKRNKEYGAYYLRKSYNKNVDRALAITITFLLLTVAIPLIANYFDAKRIIRIITTSDPTIVINPAKDPETPPPPPPPPIKENIKKIIFTAPKPSDDNTDNGPITTMDELINTPNEPINDTELYVDKDQSDKKVIEDKPDVEIHDFAGVAEQPEYPGGYEAMNKFIIDNIKYPNLAVENNIQGTVNITFVVEADGSITNFALKRSLGAGCDEEAERIVKIMPKWIPGKQNNKGVRVRVDMPVKFKIISE